METGAAPETKKTPKKKKRVGPQRRVIGLVLPEDVVTALQELETDTVERTRYVSALADAGWTLTSIGEAMGVSRERARQLAKAGKAMQIEAQEAGQSDMPVLGPVPMPPLLVTEPKPGRRRGPSTPPDILEQLLELKPVATMVRYNATKGRAEAEEYTRLIAHAHFDLGVSIYRLARDLGVTNAALRFRLIRYGYMEPPKTDGELGKVYQPVQIKNRVVTGTKIKRSA